MLDLKELDKDYRNYQTYQKAIQALEDFKTRNQKRLELLLPYYEMLEDQVNENQIKEEILFQFCAENPILYQYLELEEKVESIEPFHSDFSFTPQRFIALKHTNDDGYDLVELYTQETIPFSQFEQKKQDYIINYLKFNHSFICYATQDDLPFLMNILEEMEQPNTEFDFNDMDDEMYAKFEEQENFRLSFCRNVGLALERAHQFDESNPAMITQLAIEDYLKDRIPYLFTHGENSKVCYYMQVILKNKNVEDLYLHEKDDRQYIIEAYYKLSASQDGFDIEPIRTASPIINQEILKRKFLTK